jgi:hypothetical protein
MDGSASLPKRRRTGSRKRKVHRSSPRHAVSERTLGRPSSRMPVRMYLAPPAGSDPPYASDRIIYRDRGVARGQCPPPGRTVPWTWISGFYESQRAGNDFHASIWAQ